MICYKKLLSIIAIIHSIGCLIIFFIIILHLIFIFIFYKSQLKKIIKKTKNIIVGISNIRLIKKNKIKKHQIKFEKRRKMKKNSTINKINITTNIISGNNFYSNKSFFKLKENEQKKIMKIIKIKNYNIDEINNLSYNLALNYDKRTFCQYYSSLLKLKHNLIFSFYNNDDFNSKIIKIDLFFIGFTIDFAVNALFFNDETMHKIYVNKGLFELETQLPIAIYSFLISMILNTFLSLLGLSNDSIITFK